MTANAATIPQRAPSKRRRPKGTVAINLVIDALDHAIERQPATSVDQARHHIYNDLKLADPAAHTSQLKPPPGKYLRAIEGRIHRQEELIHPHVESFTWTDSDEFITTHTNQPTQKWTFDPDQQHFTPTTWPNLNINQLALIKGNHDLNLLDAEDAPAASVNRSVSRLSEFDRLENLVEQITDAAFDHAKVGDSAGRFSLAQIARLAAFWLLFATALIATLVLDALRFFLRLPFRRRWRELELENLANGVSVHRGPNDQYRVTSQAQRSSIKFHSPVKNKRSDSDYQVEHVLSAEIDQLFVGTTNRLIDNKGHTRPIQIEHATAATFNPDGQFLLIHDKDQSLRLIRTKQQPTHPTPLKRTLRFLRRPTIPAAVKLLPSNLRRRSKRLHWQPGTHPRYIHFSPDRPISKAFFVRKSLPTQTGMDPGEIWANSPTWPSRSYPIGKIASGFGVRSEIVHLGGSHPTSPCGRYAIAGKKLFDLHKSAMRRPGSPDVFSVRSEYFDSGSAAVGYDITAQHLGTKVHVHPVRDFFELPRGEGQPLTLKLNPDDTDAKLAISRGDTPLQRHLYIGTPDGNLTRAEIGLNDDATVLQLVDWTWELALDEPITALTTDGTGHLLAIGTNSVASLIYDRRAEQELFTTELHSPIERLDISWEPLALVAHTQTGQALLAATDNNTWINGIGQPHQPAPTPGVTRRMLNLRDLSGLDQPSNFARFSLTKAWRRTAPTLSWLMVALGLFLFLNGGLFLILQEFWKDNLLFPAQPIQLQASGTDLCIGPDLERVRLLDDPEAWLSPVDQIPRDFFVVGAQLETCTKNSLAFDSQGLISLEVTAGTGLFSRGRTKSAWLCVRQLDAKRSQQVVLVHWFESLDAFESLGLERICGVAWDQPSFRSTRHLETVQTVLTENDLCVGVADKPASQGDDLIAVECNGPNVFRFDAPPPGPRFSDVFGLCVWTFCRER